MEFLHSQPVSLRESASFDTFLDPSEKYKKVIFTVLRVFTVFGKMTKSPEDWIGVWSLRKPLKTVVSQWFSGKFY